MVQVQAQLKVKDRNAVKLETLQNQLLRLSFFNLLIISAIGLLVRALPFIDHFHLEYKNLLHGHSHFAFGGWVMPALMALVMRNFPELSQKVAYKHWKNISILLMGSAYGMLLSFPVQGYKAVSITFSTLSIGAGYYLAIVLWKALKTVEKKVSYSFIKWGLFYMAISAIGPFATGPLIVMGKQSTPIYFDSIYFYLHFQYNGLFTFLIMALIYKGLERSGGDRYGRRVFRLLNAACIPTFALSVIWNQPPIIFNIIGGVGAALQVAAMVYLLKDLQLIGWLKKASILLKISITAFCVKVMLQLLGALPVFALMGYQQRNLVIAYLHLILLGFISLFIFSKVFDSIPTNAPTRLGYSFFLFAFVATELLLVFSPFVTIHNLPALLLIFTIFFPLGISYMNYGLGKSLQFRFHFN
ncbi:MAG TPA: hypothetical protein VJ499_01070 [Flavisolibacter sp.]|nr:hypothetical protein [Flavisolibacter sp.]